MTRNAAINIATAAMTLGVIAGTLSASGPTSRPDAAIGEVQATISELRRESMTPPAGADLGDKLDKAIGRLKFPTARRHKPSKASNSQLAAAATTKPATATAATANRPPVAPTTRPATTRRRSPTISTETLAKLRKAAADGKTDPVKLADELFQAGQLDGAYALYEVAMEAKPQEETMAWILFQMGNCKRTNDPVAARKIYRRLIVTHPKSSWTPLARIQDGLLQWYVQRDPDKVLNEIDDQISSVAATTTAPATRKGKTPAN